MQQYVWGGLSSPDLHIDPETARPIYSFANHFTSLAHVFIKRNTVEDNDKALALIERFFEVVPKEHSVTQTIRSVVQIQHRSLLHCITGQVKAMARLVKRKKPNRLLLSLLSWQMKFC